MQPHPETDAVPPLGSEPTQQRYELIRPLLLDPQRTATQRAQETGTHPKTLRRLKRQFAQQGMPGLVPATQEVRPVRRRLRVPDSVVQELQRLKGLYAGFSARELARIIFHTTMYRLTGPTAQRLWARLSPAPPPRPLLTYHSHAEPAAARREVLTLYAQGWSKRSISQFLQVSRPTINMWLARFAADHLAPLEDRSRAPHTTGRKAWLPVMVEIYHLQKQHPDAGGFRIWSLRGTTDLSVRTVERIMALNRQVYTDIPGTEHLHAAPVSPQPHPFKATAAHEYWFIDGRMMDFAIAGHRWWSLIILDGYSRTMLAGATAPAEASWVALTVLYTACQRYGLPVHLISDSGGAFTSAAFEGVCRRLAIDHRTIVSTQGQSYMNLMETHFNIQRRLYDYQLARTRTPQEFDAAHQQFLALYNTTAHQGLLKERFPSPIPLHVLGASQGRLLSPHDLTRKFAQALFIRTPNRHGCVTLHRFHFYVDHGLAQRPVCLWVTGEDLRAVYAHVLVAEYTCHYDLRTGTITQLHLTQWSPSPFAAAQPQGLLLARTPQDSRIVVRPPTVRRPAPSTPQAEQLGLFAVS